MAAEPVLHRLEAEFDNPPEFIRAVTPENVLCVARDYLNPDRMVVVSAGAGKPPRRKKRQ